MLLETGNGQLPVPTSVCYEKHICVLVSFRDARFGGLVDGEGPASGEDYVDASC